MASLDRLLSLIAYSPARDQLWLVGDLVNRGPRSLDVLRWAIEHDAGITCVLGNHDLHLLARVAGATGEKKRDTLDDVLKAHDLDRIVDWLRTRPLCHVDGSLAMVHAGVHPSWDIATVQTLAAEVSNELRGPGWRAFLAQLGSGTPPRWNAKLGGGATSVVFAAHDEAMDRPVAVKMIVADLQDEREARARFYREARITSQLLHPNIVTTLDVGEDAGRPFLASFSISAVSA